MKNSLSEIVKGINVCVYDIISSEHQGIAGKDCQTISMDGAEHREKEVIVEEEILYFPKGGQAYSYRNMVLGPDETTIIGEIIYPVKTTSTLNICLKKDPTTEIEDFPCDIYTVFKEKDINSPFAPINIEKIESTITSEGNGNRLFLDIRFKKSSNGEVYSSNEEEPLLGFKISIGSKNVEFECNTKQKGVIEFDKSSEIITCNGLISLEEEIEVNSLKIEMNYDYKVKTSKSLIKIKKLNREAT